MYNIFLKTGGSNPGNVRELSMVQVFLCPQARLVSMQGIAIAIACPLP
jgi:hypothetical protein